MYFSYCLRGGHAYDLTIIPTFVAYLFMENASEDEIVP